MSKCKHDDDAHPPSLVPAAVSLYVSVVVQILFGVKLLVLLDGPRSASTPASVIVSVTLSGIRAHLIADNIIRHHSA